MKQKKIIEKIVADNFPNRLKHIKLKPLLVIETQTG